MLDVGPIDVLLDAGCGDGRLIREIASRVAYAVGLDASHGAIRLATNSIDVPNVSFLQGDITELDVILRGRRFTKVTCLEVLEMVGEPERALVNLIGCLAPGGVLFLTVPLRGPGVYPLGRNGTVKLLEAHGCRVERVLEIKPPRWTLVAMRFTGLIRTLQGRQQSQSRLLEDTYLFSLTRTPSRAFRLYCRIVWPVLRAMMWCDRKLYREPGAMLVVMAKKAEQV